MGCAKLHTWDSPTVHFVVCYVKRNHFEADLNYSNSKFKVTFKNVDFECHIDTSNLIQKKKQSKISNTTFTILSFSHKNTFQHFGVYFSKWNHQICFKMVHSNTKNMQNLEFVNLECVTYAQPIPLALNQPSSRNTLQSSINMIKRANKLIYIVSLFFHQWVVMGRFNTHFLLKIRLNL